MRTQSFFIALTLLFPVVASGHTEPPIRRPTKAPLEVIATAAPPSASDALQIDRDTVHLSRKTAGVLMLLAGLITTACVWMFVRQLQFRRKTRHLDSLTAAINEAYQSIDESVVLFDVSRRVASINAQFAKTTGISLSVGDAIEDLSDQLNQRFSPVGGGDKFWTQFTSESTESIEREMQSSTTSQRVTVSLSPIRDHKNKTIGRLLIISDITQQKQLEDHLLQSQKMGAVGDLAGGIAHDFNNLLMVMSFNVEHANLLLNREESDKSDIQTCLNDTETAIHSATELVKNLLDFSRKSPLNLQEGSLNDSVEQVARMVRRTFSSSVQLETDLESELMCCRMDQAQIEQVLMNACLNARDALRNGAGSICISTANVKTDEGQMVQLCVADNGIGMSEDQQQRLFERFDTTKDTGLGMSMSLGIVAQHGGCIECVSAPGDGTRINILLPASAESLEHQPSATPRPTVLLADRASSDC